MAFHRTARGPWVAVVASLAVGALSLVVPSAAAATPTPSATSHTAGLSYVALGDSYAAGYGISPRTLLPVAGCGQSANDYPHRIARALDLQLTDQTCAGALTSNLVSTPQPVGSTPAPVQSTALGTATRVVTITIGGNDLGLVKVLENCVAKSAHGPILTTGRRSCRSTYVKNGVDTLAKAITDSVSGRLARTFSMIKADAPNARIFVVGYTSVMPDADNTPRDGCFSGDLSLGLRTVHLTDAFPYTNTDVVYLRSVEVALDRAMRAAALHAGFSFTSTLAGSDAHTPCGATSWMNGVSVISTKGTASFDPYTLHPNRLGAAYLASAVIPAIKSAFSSRTPARTASPPDSSLIPWYLSLSLVVLVLVAAAVMVIRRRNER